MDLTHIGGRALDPEQRAALGRFLDDLSNVLAQSEFSTELFDRTLGALGGAYHAALITGKWHIVVAILTETLDDIVASQPTVIFSGAYRRLRSIVWENLDLLPTEMLRLA